MKLAIFIVLIVISLSVVTTVYANYDSFFGNGAVYTSSSIWRYLDNSATKIGARFTQFGNKTVSHFMIYFISMTGITNQYFRISIQEDNTSTGFPIGTYLTHFDFIPNTYFFYLDIPDINLTDSLVYHFVLENINGTIDGTHYLAPYSDPIYPVMFAPNHTDNNYYQTDFYNGVWLKVFRLTSFVLEYTDNSYYGNPYYSGSHYNVYANSNIGEKFKIFENHTITGLEVMLARSSTSYALYINIYNHNTSTYELLNFTAFPYGINNILTTTGYWIQTILFGQDILLEKDNIYTLWFNSSGTSSNSWKIGISNTYNNATWINSTFLGANAFTVYGSGNPPISEWQNYDCNIVFIDHYEMATESGYSEADTVMYLLLGALLGLMAGSITVYLLTLGDNRR